MLNSVRNHLGDLHGVGLRSSQLRQVSVSPHDNGVPKWLGLSSTPAACLLRCIDQVEPFLKTPEAEVCAPKANCRIPINADSAPRQFGRPTGIWKPQIPKISIGSSLRTRNLIAYG